MITELDMDGVDMWFMKTIQRNRRPYQMFHIDYINVLQKLIDNGYIEKVKCNNAPDDLVITPDGHVSGVFNATPDGAAWLAFQEL